MTFLTAVPALPSELAALALAILALAGLVAFATLGSRTLEASVLRLGSGLRSGFPHAHVGLKQHRSRGVELRRVVALGLESVSFLGDGLEPLLQRGLEAPLTVARGRYSGLRRLVARVLRRTGRVDLGRVKARVLRLRVGVGLVGLRTTSASA